MRAENESAEMMRAPKKNSHHYLNFYLNNRCCETIMFGRVTHTLDAAAMRARSFVYVTHIL